MDALERFWAKVTPLPNGCLAWTGGHTLNGYGQFNGGGRSKLAHRWAYERFVGPIPDGLELDHLCSKRDCVQVDHLEAVTHKVNCRRGQGDQNHATKTQCPQGHPYDLVNTIRRLNGGRQCRICTNISQKKSRQRLRNTDGR